MKFPCGDHGPKGGVLRGSGDVPCMARFHFTNDRNAPPLAIFGEIMSLFRCQRMPVRDELGVGVETKHRALMICKAEVEGI